MKRFEKGIRVVYMPSHANNDINHKDCERGVVSSVNDKYVFVKFDSRFLRVLYITGDEDVTAQSCRPEDLIREDEVEFINNI